jgi:hypothetical protein
MFTMHLEGDVLGGRVVWIVLRYVSCIGWIWVDCIFLMCSMIRNSLKFVINFFDPAMEVYQFFVVLYEPLAIRVRPEHVQRFLK